MKTENQKGIGTLAMVLMLGFFMITSFTAFYTYSASRMNQLARIRETYNLVNVMETAGRIVRDNFQRQMATNGGALPARLSFQAALTDTSQCGACPDRLGETKLFCVQNVTNPGRPYCFYSGGVQMAQKRIQGYPTEAPSRRERVLANLDSFLNRLSTRFQTAYQETDSRRSLFSRYALAFSKAIANPPAAASPSLAIQTGNIDGVDCKSNPSSAACFQCNSSCAVISIRPPWADPSDASKDIRQAFGVILN